MDDKKLYRKTLLLVFIVGILIVGFQMVITKSFFVGFGDYYDQQIAFYQHAHDFVRNGNWLWDWSSEMGSEFIPTYAFYLTFSPFFLITLLFPNNWIIYLMPLLLVLKFVLASGTTILWLKNKIKNPKIVCLGAFIYSFSGWMLDSIFFNHFLEVTAFFPLYLLIVEETLTRKKKYILIFMTSFMLLLNYYFFFGQLVFLFLYLIVRKLFNKSWDVTYKSIFRTLFEGFLGIALTSVFLLPIANTVFQNPRSTTRLNPVYYFVYENVQMYFSIIRSLIAFPETLIYKGGLFRILKYGLPSQVLYVPIVGAFFLPLFFVKSKEKWLKVFLIVLLIFSFVPILNASFSMFNATYYARWFYMFSLFIMFASIKIFDELDFEIFKKEFKWSIFIVGIVYAILVLFGYLLNIRVNDSLNYFNIVFSIATTLIMIATSYFLLIIKNINKYIVSNLIIGIICIVSFYSISTIPYYDATNDIEASTYEELVAIEKLDFDDEEFYRINSSHYLNTGLLHNKSSVSGYNSIISPSMYNFYSLLGVEREVKSNFIKTDNIINNIFSVKYLVDKDGIIENPDYLPIGIIFPYIKQVPSYYQLNLDTNDIINNLYLNVLDYEYYEEFINAQNKKDEEISNYEKKHYIEGIEVTEKILKNKKMYSFENNKKQDVILKDFCKDAVSVFINGSNAKTSLNGFCKNNDLLVTSWGHINVEIEYDYKVKEEKIKSANLKNMEFNQYGMEADSSLENDSLVFFSIPYSNLWDIEIDGIKTDFIKGFDSFIVLKVPAGNHHISFKYSTKYYKLGAIVSLICLIIVIIYIVIDKSFFTKNKRRTH